MIWKLVESNGHYFCLCILVHFVVLIMQFAFLWDCTFSYSILSYVVDINLWFNCAHYYMFYICGCETHFVINSLFVEFWSPVFGLRVRSGELKNGPAGWRNPRNTYSILSYLPCNRGTTYFPIFHLVNFIGLLYVVRFPKPAY